MDIPTSMATGYILIALIILLLIVGIGSMVCSFLFETTTENYVNTSTNKRFIKDSEPILTDTFGDFFDD